MSPWWSMWPAIFWRQGPWRPRGLGPSGQGSATALTAIPAVWWLQANLWPACRSWRRSLRTGASTNIIAVLSGERSGKAGPSKDFSWKTRIWIRWGSIKKADPAWRLWPPGMSRWGISPLGTGRGRGTQS